MTIRDIAVSFGFEIDKSSVREAESSIKGIKNMATKLLGAIGIGLSIAGISGLAEAAAEVSALKSQFSQVFREMEKEAASRLQAVADDTGVNANRMKASFSGIAAFAKVSGVEQEDALDLSERAMIAVADSAAYYDRSIEAVTESLRSFLKGNYENDAALGLSATETTRNAAANNLYGKSFKDLSEAEKQFTLLKMVEDANKASGALGQAARESDTWTNQLGNLKQGLFDLKAAAGSTILQPAVAVLKLLVGMTNQATRAVEGLTAEGGLLTRSTERYHALIKRLHPTIDRMTQTFFRGMTKGTEAVKGVVNRLGGIENVLKVLAIAAGAFFLVMNWGRVLSGAGMFVRLLSSIGKMFTLANLKILAVVSIIVILALIVEDFFNFLMGNDSVIGTVFDRIGIGADRARQMVFDAWGRLQAFLMGVWDFLRSAAGMWADSVHGFFEKHNESIRSNFERAWGIICTFLNGAWTFLSQLADTLFGQTENSIYGSAQGTKAKLLSIWQAILLVISAIWDAMYEIGSAIFNALAMMIETVFRWIQIFWSNWGTQILAWFQVIWNSLGGILYAFLDILEGIANFISSVFTGDWQGAWEAVCQIFIGIWQMIINFATAVWATIQLLFEIGLSAVQTGWNTAWEAVSNFFQGIWNGILSFIDQILTSMHSSITNRISSIKDVIVNGFTAATDWIKGLPAQAFQWGADFIGGLKNGILSGVKGVVDAVKGVGEQIRSYLHFSVPDVGPLTDYESWMPDFMGGLAKGIANNRGTVLEQVRGLANGIQVLMSAATAKSKTVATSTVNHTTSSITQNVNIDNTYHGGSTETQKNVSRAMKKSAVDATTQMARGLAYARG